MKKKLLQKFFANQCNEEEFRKVMKYFLNEENKDQTLNDLESAWYDYSSAESFKEQRLQHIKIKLSQSISRPKIEVNNSFSGYRYYNKIAAALLLIAIVALGVLYNLQPDVPSLETYNEIPQVIQKENPKGQKLRVSLKDGSVVIMNAESQITYNSGFGIDNRMLQLKGEAFFEVKENEELPFMVDTQEMQIVALGTSFNVQSVEHKGFGKVALASGKVKISSENNDIIILEPGEMVSIKDQRFSGKQIFDPVEELGWKDGLLVFRNNSLSEVVQKLERWYGVEIIVTSYHNHPDWSYTSQFDNVSLEKVLQGISFTKNIEYKIDGEIVKIKL